MLFNSLDFAVFFPLVFLLYWTVFNGEIRLRNAFLLVASYFFYGWWDWRFLFLIAFSSIVDYVVALQLDKARTQVHRKYWLVLSLTVNLGLLGVFKYYNFFAENLVEAFTLFGRSLQLDSLQWVLPVGISFYTFQTLSYTIDVYRRKLEPTRDLLKFMAFVSFFPQLVAGPIERASALLPQFDEPKKFDYAAAVDGMRQILIGLFKKMVIADNCAVLVNDIFANYTDYPGSTLVLGAIFFAFQIYCDFSGYSDIAIGVARMMGFELMRNFAYPYFSRDVGEFWRRWHISLSTWFRDYVYIPLGGSRGGTNMVLRNTLIIFLVSGFWHGPNWTFIFWGGLNAFLYVPLLLLGRNRLNTNIVAENSSLPSLRELWGMLSTFALITLGWIFFRASSITEAFGYLERIASFSLFEMPRWAHMESRDLAVIPMIVFLLLLEWNGRRWAHALERVWLDWWGPLRWMGYAGMVFCIFFLSGEEQNFIYFQF